jgi:hypothetical protein
MTPGDELASALADCAGGAAIFVLVFAWMWIGHGLGLG